MSGQTEPSFEQSLAELEAIVHDLEDDKLGLAGALGRYEEGVKHLKNCYALLTQAEQKIEVLTGVTASGEAITEPMTGADEPTKPPTRRRAKAKPAQPAAEPGDDELFGFSRDIDG